MTDIIAVKPVCTPVTLTVAVALEDIDCAIRFTPLAVLVLANGVF